MNAGDNAAPSLPSVLRMMYWSAGRDRRRIPHLLAVLASFARTAATLIWRRRILDRRRPVSIALVEHLGDIVAGEPVARYARRRFPSAPLLWFVRAPYAEIPRSFPEVDDVVTVRCLTEWMLLRGAGLAGDVLDLHISGRYCPKCSIPLAKSGAAGAMTPETYYDFGNLLGVECQSAGIEPIAESPVLHPGAPAMRKADGLSLPERFVVIHCASNEVQRDWPTEEWHRLLQHLGEVLGFDVIEVGLSPRAVKPGVARQRSLCGQLSILETAEVIRRARLFIGIDSGPAHLANAVGTPGVILLGRYRSFVRYTPYSGRYADGSGADLVRASGPVAGLLVEAVMAAVGRRLLGS